jgi:glycosyltransferase involved in cell wall biosynthesis
MKLSVIVPTRNRAALLAKALRSLRTQDLPADQFEVLVIDSGSTDNTRDIVAQAQAEQKNLYYFFATEPGLHAARHLGMAKARSDVLVFTDDDIEALPAWLAAVAAGFSRHQATLLGGKCLPKFEADPPRWLMKRWTTPNGPGYFLPALSILDFGDAVKEIPPTFVIGCNFAIRKDALKAAGGFHPDAMPEELLLYRGDGETWVGRAVAARGGKVLYHPRAAVFHFVPAARMSADYFYRRTFAEGISRSFVHCRRINQMDDFIPAAPAATPSWPRQAYRFIKQVKSAFSPQQRLRRIEQKGLRDGYRCHQERFSQDAKLRAWVLRRDWLDDSAAGKTGR